MTAALVVGWRILPHPEKIGDLHRAFVLQRLVLILRDLAHASFFAINLDAGEVFGKAFLKPGIDARSKDSVHELVGIFVEDHTPGILSRHVEHDEAAVLATLEQPSQLHRLPVLQGRKLSQFFGIAESNNLQRYGKVHVRLGHQSAEDGPHLLEAHGGLATSSFARLGHHGEMRRLNFNPLWVAGRRDRDRAQSERKQEARTDKPAQWRTHSQTLSKDSSSARGTILISIPERLQNTGVRLCFLEYILRSTVRRTSSASEPVT